MSIITKNVGQLLDYRFFVPSYQRGYRWTEHEVTALLDDIYEFSTEDGKRYCIQPLIVKRRADGSFEVVDGQQRLTTIYIFLKIAEDKTEIPPFNLEYETRKNSQKFLSELTPKGKIDNENIDYYHITKAREAINTWLDEANTRHNAINGKLLRHNVINKIFEKLTESVIFIWYEIPAESDPITIFTKVNLGKIPLTNAELIKALLLNKNNFRTDIDKRQKEISHAWDRIEQRLRDDSFWYFLNEKEQSGTRIDLLFELLANDYNGKYSDKIDSDQNYYPFLVFLAAFNAVPDKEAFVKEIWEDKIEKLYADFNEWYSDLNKYHIIGYLIASKFATIADICKIARDNRKSAVLKFLLENAKKEIDKFDLKKIAYENNNERQKIRKLLLMFNIATLVCKSEKQYRFPFDIYKGETESGLKWDIEHIHATADETDEADDSLGNLALLDEKTNRSYKDAPFKDKRRIILERESKGLFVPLCTKNVFLKVYSTDVGNMEKWEDKDKNDYLEAMEQTLTSFFNGKFING